MINICFPLPQVTVHTDLPNSALAVSVPEHVLELFILKKAIEILKKYF